MSIPDYKAMAEFEAKLLTREPRSLSSSLDLLDAMVEEAKALGRWPVSQGPGDIEHKIRWARAANSVGLASDG
jgi:hypothetical protein